MSPSRLLRLCVTAASSALASGGCAESGIAPDASAPWSIKIVAGSEQVALPGAELPTPLEVEVRHAVSGDRVPGLVVTFVLESGDGARLEPSEALTDAAGRARAQLRLGPGPDTVRVRARVRDSDVFADFMALAVPIPELDPIPVPSARAGARLELTGRHLAPPGGAVVAFTGIRGRVLASDGGRIEVEVPPCLPDGAVTVRVEGPTGGSVVRDVLVEAAGAARVMALGEVVDIAGVGNDGCARLRLAPGQEVALSIRSSAALVGLPRGFTVHTLARRPSGTEEIPELVASTTPRPFRGPRALERSRPEVLRSAEHRALRGVGSQRLRAVVEANAGGRPAAVPGTGEQRDFQVLQSDGTFRTISAEVRHVGARAAFYVESSLTDPGRDDPMLQDLGALFDGPVWDVDTGLYGEASDLDGDGRIAVLMTRSVNRFASQDGQGRVGGFFFGADLLPGQPGSNGGEILYVIAPDPDGDDGPPISRDEVWAGLPGVLVHEFQHLVHFNERVLKGGAGQPEATWLAEALATVAEDRLAARLALEGEVARAATVERGNHDRAREFLATPWDVTLIIQLGTGTLAERGAGWLFLRYLTERFGLDLLGTLTRGGPRGVQNVEAATGLDWDRLLADWGIALVADASSRVADPLRYPGLDVATRIGPLGWQGAVDPDRTAWEGQVRASALAHLLLTGDRVEEVALGLSGPGGVLPDPEDRLGLRAVRVR